ncbi:MAG: 4Fe-4S binding protein [Pirellulales bacterium]
MSTARPFCRRSRISIRQPALVNCQTRRIRRGVQFALRAITLFLLVLPLSQGSTASAAVDYSRPVNAAPKPEDISGAYEVPPVQRVAPRSEWMYGVDVVLLAGGLIATALVVHRWRRRWMAVAISIASLAYFGFYRQGCVCPIGSMQNVTTALVDPTLAIPLVVLLFFLLPLIAALLAGRVFCGGVCPLGAIQDLVVIKPLQLPQPIDRWGGKFRYFYLALAIWFAAQPAASRDFIICRFDPFVAFFRLNGSLSMLAYGALLLLLGTIIGRPYCRFLCPYGGLLGLVSRFAFRPVQISPDEELDCGLCAESCPFGAIKNLRADRMECVACARCFVHCPRQRYQWGEIQLIEVEELVKSHASQARAVAKPIDRSTSA